MGIMISISQASVLVHLPLDIADKGTCQVFSSFCQYSVFLPGAYREKRRNFFSQDPTCFCIISQISQLAQFSQSYKIPQWSGVELVYRRPQSRQMGELGRKESLWLRKEMFRAKLQHQSLSWWMMEFDGYWALRQVQQKQKEWGGRRDTGKSP